MTTDWIGQSTKRMGGVERVTGLQRYVGDLRLEEMLHIKLVHLNCAYAQISSIDTREAQQVAGVRCILTAADLPQPVPRFGPTYRDRPVLAVDEVKFYGEPVAAIAAESEDAAAAAAALVRVEYEELPGVFTVAAALDPASPLVQEPDLRPSDPLNKTNIMGEWKYGWGNVDECQADWIIDQVYTFPMVTHFAIEPHAFIAMPEKDGVVIWSAIQHPYDLQRTIAVLLNLPVAKVRVIAPDPGGGFGGKGYPKFEPLLAFLALKTGRPVRLALTLEESFQAVRRASAQVRMRTGFSADGKIVFRDVEGNFLIGAYVDIAARVVGKASYVACGPYRIPHARILGRALFSHTTPSTAFRGFGIPQYAWASESQMNEAARQLGLDPVEIRLRNLPEPGEIFIPGDTPADGNWAEVVRRAADAIGWGQPLIKGCGRGLAIGLKNSATVAASYAILRLHYDSSVSLMAGTSDMGQGARTVFCQIIAQELGLPAEQVVVVMGDTATVPYDLSTSASRSTVFMGTAVLNACRNIKTQLKEFAMEAFSLPETAVTVGRGVIHLPDQDLSYQEFLREYFGPVRGEVIAVGSARGKRIPGHPLGGKAAFYELACTAAEVEVDVETGAILITKLVMVGDVGKALNPQHVEMQDEGATVMGLGHTLMEHLILDDSGRILNLGALDYRIPTIQDIPLELHTISVENGDGPGPFGAKGVGESGILAVAPAVGAAVNEATGVVIRELPLTPERVWQALVEQH